MTTGELAQWEMRTVKRILDLNHDQVLERSRELVEAAYDLLKDEGLDGLTIRGVLQKTGLSRRAFYERFSSKDDLMLAVFEETIRKAATFYGQAVAQLPSPTARLELIVKSIITGSSITLSGSNAQSDRRGIAMSREHMRLTESHPEELQKVLQPLLSLLTEILTAGMEMDEVWKTDPERLATLVYNLVSTTAHTELLTRRLTSEQRLDLANDVWEFCHNAIAKR